MSAAKTAVTAGSLIFIMLFGGGVFLLMNLGSIAKNISEREASKALGVAVSIGAVDIDIQNLAVTVRNISVANPSSYKGRHAATIETISLKAEALSDVLLHFNDVNISGTDIYLEVKPGRTNLSDIKANVDTKAATGNTAAKQIKVIINKMRIDNVHVIPSITLLSQSDLKPVTIPDIVLDGIGVKENGVLGRDAVKQIWTQLLPHIQRAASGAGFYEGLSSDALKDIGLSQVEGVKTTIKKEIEGIGGNLGKSLGGFFSE